MCVGSHGSLREEKFGKFTSRFLAQFQTMCVVVSWLVRVMVTLIMFGQTGLSLCGEGLPFAYSPAAALLTDGFQGCAERHSLRSRRLGGKTAGRLASDVQQVGCCWLHLSLSCPTFLHGSRCDLSSSCEVCYGGCARMVSLRLGGVL